MQPTAEQFPADVRFRGQWRTYQARVLQTLEEHLDDNRLHVVAAPGSGKTLLGLEVTRRINRPTIILAPTRAIRDQWIERLCDFFMESNTIPNWISRDVRNPKFLTVSTYQGLYTAFSGLLDEFEEEDIEAEKDDKEEELVEAEQIIEALTQVGLGTIVLDEAHHLRVNWWRCLHELLEKFPATTRVSLTATPPYDVSIYEWSRYIELCGPIDAEVSVPELVEAGNLCPHQDLLIFTAPSFVESDKIREFRQKTERFIDEFKDDDRYLTFVQNHPWILSPEDHLEEILEDAEFFSSMLVYLEFKGFKIPKSTRELVVGSYHALPRFTQEWLEILLEGLLFPGGVETKDLDPLLLETRHRLSRMGALRRRNVEFENPKKLERVLRRSTSKLFGIQAIVDIEYQSLKDNLRMVILTDYIREAYLQESPDQEIDLDRIGAAPIFETLRKRKIQGCKLGILTGSLVVVPSQSESLLKSCANDIGIDIADLRLEPLPDKDYSILRSSSETKEKIVQLITDLFMEGGINALVGTKSLLGEGWDAPCINSLVIASFVGSYMLSNQMRGRAIRVYKGKKSKVANIWHIVCVETNSEKLGHDYDIMVRRFRAFLGVSSAEPVIENGIDRLNLPDPPYTQETIASINRQMVQEASAREELRSEWDAALKRGEDGVRLVEDVVAKKTHMPRGFVFVNTIEALGYEIVILLALFLVRQATSFFFPMPDLGIVWLSYIAQIGLLLFALRFLPKLYRAVRLFVLHGPVKSSLKQVGKALLTTLCEVDLIRTDSGNLEVVTDEGSRGSVFCHIKGGTSREQSLYLESLRELLGPILSPRYLLMRKTKLGESIIRRDYHSVPSVLGINRRFAERFAANWKKQVGDMQLIYTRSREGRIALLRARNYSLSAGFRPKTERISRWK
ncbi:DEAD/DEAH box helicase [Candidatus Thorarchaeota archaeon]|nr:MAG: DEAD/DEAH box helicase [Candidatus Thorarchaeota archaeon]